MLGLLRRSFKNTTSTPQKKLLYISLVRSQLMYCSPLWRPYLIKDICKIENIQRRATKYVLNNYRDDYKSRLISLNLLPLMCQLEVNDILAAVTWFKYPGSHFNITNFVSFNQNSTRAGAHRKLCHYYSNSRGTNSFYFRRLPRLWNALPPIDLDKPLSAIKASIIGFMYKDFITSFVSSNPCTFHFQCPCSKCSNIPSAPSFD